jgi:hypothetical protein
MSTTVRLSVVRGAPTLDELAVLTTVLLSRANAAVPPGPVVRRAPWSRDAPPRRLAAGAQPSRQWR